MKSFKVYYSTWKNRILPILKISGWIDETIDDKTYKINYTIGYRFEYRNYGKSAQVWVGELEVIE